MRAHLLVLVCLAALAVPVGAATTTAPAKGTTAKGAAAKGAATKWNPVVPFIEDDFGRALALAKSRRLPVFIEGWAPW